MSTISHDDMRENITNGPATPLLPDGVPGPVHFDGHWWSIPHGAEAYHQVTGSDLISQLDQAAERLAAGVRAVRDVDAGGGR